MEWAQIIGIAVIAGTTAYYIEHMRRETERALGRKMDVLTRRIAELEKEVSRLNGRLQMEIDGRAIRQRSQEPRDQ